jgi:Tfp pilus assembly protein PilV
MTPRATRAASRGTSLVEALVALAVMAFGMLAVIGIQATLRGTADVSKQRSEAVRIAQEAMEAARAFSAIDAGAGQVAYADVGDVAGVAVVGYTTNTVFNLSQAVVARTNPDRKELRVRVDWADRNGEAQRVELNGVVGANDPRVSLALGAQPKGIPIRQPWGRNPAIPPTSVGVGVGLSAFKPPLPGTDNGSVVWVLNDLTGMIVGICEGVATRQESLTAADIASCADNTTAQLLSGFVRFATRPVQPSAAEAENPTSSALNLGVDLALTSLGHPSPDHVCLADAPLDSVVAEPVTAVRYYCAVFSNDALVWSGTSTLQPRGFSDNANLPWVIAADAADAALTRYRVCRYTPAASDADVIPNFQHPRSYRNVKAREPLTNQNFLVIRAGDGTVPFACPTDAPANPSAGDFVNSNTLVHQPAP